MNTFFDINTTFFTFWGYPMSFIEFFGTVLNIWCVWLAARRNILTWPVGIGGIILYIFLFYQIQLYSDLAEQWYFLATSFWGWWVWSRMPKGAAKKKVPLVVLRSSFRGNAWTIGVVIVGTLIMTYITSHLHLWLPKWFLEPASYPLLDAFTTVMSFVATVLMVRKYAEAWMLWILVDIIGIGLYFVKGVKFISLEYVVFLALAIKGFVEWSRAYGKRRSEEQSSAREQLAPTTP